MTGIIFGIKRGEIHDGDGIRTTVFLKGCPLRCIWCHNPEGLSPNPQTGFFRRKCVECGNCGLSERLRADREACLRCPSEALQFFGEERDAAALADELAADAPFFRASGGGVTLSGGECLLQPDFVLALMQEMKKREISVNIDTCGFVRREVLKSVLPDTDTFLYDIKAMDSELHRRLTGQDNRVILENLRFLVAEGARIEVRIPLVVGCNDREIPAIGRFLSALGGIQKVKVLRYHRLAESRYEALGMQHTLPSTVTTQEDAENAVRTLRSFGLQAFC